MRFAKCLLFFIILFVCVSWLVRSPWLKEVIIQDRSRHSSNLIAGFDEHAKTKLRADMVRKFVSKYHYNDRTCFLINMSLPSGRYRFYVYDLKKDSVTAEGLVAHGNCFQEWLAGRKYSNVVGCGCTSLGKYRIGNSYTGKFGYSYKLYGLDSSNNNAFERTVVLHSHTCVPSSQTDDEICQSNGCPMVSPSFLEIIKPIINHSSKPILLWIYE
jgi:hypothetical protein